MTALCTPKAIWLIIQLTASFTFQPKKIHSHVHRCITHLLGHWLCWNGNGSFWSSPGLLYDALGSTDILFVTETHASRVRPLPDFTGYHWLSVCRQETRSSGGVRGSGGVACLTRDSLQNMVSLVATDEFSRFMWVRVRARVTPPRDIYIAVCYFPPASSSFAIHNDFNGDPFIDLYTGITQYSVVGEVILLVDFNARTRDLQTPLHDRQRTCFVPGG
jgi:hypothetical protein